MAEEKLPPHTMNSITPPITNDVNGDSEYKVVSQKGIHDMVISSGGFVDAPADGKTYVRKNNQWIEVVAITEAPTDGYSYVRQNGKWVMLSQIIGGGV